jgi:hypothetical protein
MLALAVVLLITQAMIGLNFAPEGEPLPTYLRVMQWFALALAAAGVLTALLAVAFIRRR